MRSGKEAAFRLQDLEVAVHRIIPDVKNYPEDDESVMTISKMSENLKCDQGSTAPRGVAVICYGPEITIQRPDYSVHDSLECLEMMFCQATWARSTGSKWYCRQDWEAVT